MPNNGSENKTIMLKDTNDWEFIRIAHLSQCMSCQDDPLEQVSTGESTTTPSSAGAWTGPSPPAGTMWAGVFAASPEDQQGGHATFTHFEVRHGSHFEHNADGNQDSSDGN